VRRCTNGSVISNCVRFQDAASNSSGVMSSTVDGGVGGGAVAWGGAPAGFSSATASEA
jgi:hypothetical protein